MNITGYKQKKKNIIRLIKTENTKEHPNKSKIERLEKANINCSQCIRKIKSTQRKS